ncbi:hypothetical protein [Vibrio ziniensis]|uniref:Uncharacterized protein n=1 Tax=Vibrio ziniensis TaxID=2711221 RepID=A0A6G7CPR5_9VIBR|nr:hypothetical protein [Vibrio ziniensis]QIH44141.1 hypothetical protein G5S32_19445 [Vibrio ziniensis]
MSNLQQLNICILGRDREGKATCINVTLVVMSSIGYDDNIFENLMSLSLEELSMLNVEMETATKSARRLTDTPSSVT